MWCTTYLGLLVMVVILIVINFLYQLKLDSDWREALNRSWGLIIAVGVVSFMVFITNLSR